MHKQVTLHARLGVHGKLFRLDRPAQTLVAACQLARVRAFRGAVRVALGRVDMLLVPVAAEPLLRHFELARASVEGQEAHDGNEVGQEAGAERFDEPNVQDLGHVAQPVPKVNSGPSTTCSAQLWEIEK